MRFVGVDAFTSEAFHGNPAVVCLLDEPIADERAAALAAEFNQPATAFVHVDGEAVALRWFSAVTELPLCGHGTLAAAHALYQNGFPADRPITFHTRKAVLTASQAEGRIWLEFPALPSVSAPADPDVLAALGVERVAWFGHDVDAPGDLVVVLDSAAEVTALRPDFARLLELPLTKVIASAAGGAGADFTSRVFPPKYGFNEDHVTGSAHALLGPFWAARLGRTEFTAVQASPRRGELAVHVAGDTVRLGGRALTTMTGDLQV